MSAPKKDCACALAQRLPRNADCLSKKVNSPGSTSLSKSLSNASRPLSTLVEFQEDRQEEAAVESLSDSVPSSTSSSNFEKPGQLTYASIKEAIVLTAPASTMGAIQPNETVEILIALKEQYLPWSHTEMKFNLVGTCLICQFEHQWHANFSTETGVSISDSAVFSLSAPAKSQHVVACAQTTTYSLWASIRIPGQVNCHCQRPNIQGVNEASPKPTKSVS